MVTCSSVESFFREKFLLWSRVPVVRKTLVRPFLQLEGSSYYTHWQAEWAMAQTKHRREVSFIAAHWRTSPKARGRLTISYSQPTVNFDTHTISNFDVHLMSEIKILRDEIQPLKSMYTRQFAKPNSKKMLVSQYLGSWDGLPRGSSYRAPYRFRWKDNYWTGEKMVKTHHVPYRKRQCVQPLHFKVSRRQKNPRDFGIRA